MIVKVIDDELKALRLELDVRQYLKVRSRFWWER